jgi:hypothetical protein
VEGKKIRPLFSPKFVVFKILLKKKEIQKEWDSSKLHLTVFL